MEGLRIGFEEQCDNIVKRLLKGIKFDGYDFDIDLIESYEGDMGDDWEDLSELTEVTTRQAKKRLLEIDDECAAPEFLELLIRPNNVERKYIELYEEFLEGGYEMSLIIIDHRNIEICCKNKNWLDQIITNAETLKERLNLKYKKLYQIKPKACLYIYRSRGSIAIYD